MEDTQSNNAHGQCRCCLAIGHHKNLRQEYFFNGFREVYNEIFTNVFNLTLSNNKHLTSLICATCIQRLRDATSFRMMVVSTEKQLLDNINNSKDNFVSLSVTDDDTLDSEVEVKIEAQVKEETANCDSTSDLEHFDDDFISDELTDSQCTQDSVELDSVEGEATLLARYRNVPALPDRDTLPEIFPEFCRQLDMLQAYKVVPSAIEKLLDDTELLEEHRSARQKFVTEKLAHIVNATTILECSNVTPFRSKSRQGFPCFYCRIVFDNMKDLREHNTRHSNTEILKVLKTFGAESLAVYVDITDLKCTLCKKAMANLNELKFHLVNVHKKKMHLEFTDRVIPFKLTSPSSEMFDCQMCGFHFETFGAIERHMNVHFRNYICKDCGTGFVTRYRLKVHIKSLHSDVKHPCEVCGKIFNSTQKHKNHVNTVHKNMKRFKCTKCPERFAEYFRRQKHMVTVHDVAPLKYTCNVCDRSFDRRYTLSRHMKRDHLEERDYECEMCSYKCFTKNELRVHMIKHNGERIYECTVCKKAYARQKTLKEHMRIHNNDRRFACAVCGQAFVQKCSLKGHLKTHHLEFNIP